MPRSPAREPSATKVALDRIRSGAPQGVAQFQEVLTLLAEARARSTDAGRELDHRIDLAILKELTMARNGLSQIQGTHEQLREMMEKITAPPLHPATFLGETSVQGRASAIVADGSATRVVRLGEDVEADSLRVGDAVLLNHERHLLVCSSDASAFQCGETASYERKIDDGRMVVRSRDEEYIVQASSALESTELSSGDPIRWNRQALIAVERITRPSGEHLFLENTPDETFDALGGLDRQIKELKGTFQMHLDRPDLVERYSLRRRRSVLLVGEPGNGKTMMARALANWLRTVSPSGHSHFMHIKPGALGSVYYSQAEANFREAFRVARKAGGENGEVPVVMFFDEVDSLGGTRGESLNRVDDRVLQSFLVELDGLDDRGNIVVVAATNRADALDPALKRPGRLQDKLIEVPRPGMQAARSIFEKHLPGTVPYVEGNDPVDRHTIIEGVIGRIFAPNADTALASLIFRDNSRHTVHCHDLVSGAVIANVAREGRECAAARHAAGQGQGVTIEDLIQAAENEFEAAVRALTPRNCRRYISAVPADKDVVAVEPVRRPTARAHRYLAVA